MGVRAVAFLNWLVSVLSNIIMLPLRGHKLASNAYDFDEGTPSNHFDHTATESQQFYPVQSVVAVKPFLIVKGGAPVKNAAHKHLGVLGQLFPALKNLKSDDLEEALSEE